MAGRLITAVVGSQELVGPDWRLAAERPIEAAEQPSCPEGDGWVAVLGVRRGLKLQVTGDSGPGSLLVEAWAGEPGDSTDGVAVIERADGGLALARVPLCGCGTRGCGNAGVQLRKLLPPGDLPALADLLRSLPWTDAVPSRTNVLRGDGLAALSEPRFAGRGKMKVVFHGSRMQDGVRVPVTRVMRDDFATVEQQPGQADGG